MDMLGVMTPTEFLRDYWQKKPLVIRQAFPGFQCPVSADELKQMRASSADPRHCRERMRPRCWILVSGSHGQDENCWVVFWCAPGLRNRSDLINHALAVGIQATLRSDGVFARKFSLARVIRAALATENQKTVQSFPVIDAERVAAGAVLDLSRV